MLEFDILQVLSEITKPLTYKEIKGEIETYLKEARALRAKYSDGLSPEYNYKDIPSTAEESFDAMSAYSGKICFNILRCQFLIKNFGWEKSEVQSEIESINKLINRAKTVNLYKAVTYDEEFTGQDMPKEYFFVRILKNYYQQEGQRLETIPMISSLAWVFAECFLFLPFLESKIASYAVADNVVEDEMATLKSVCKPEYYDEMIKDMVKKGIIDNESMKWKDTPKGYKSYVNAFITVLENKGYISGKVRPQKRQYIIKNTFEFDISLETLKREPAGTILRKFDFLKSKIRQV